jgi:hypothetical protein
MMVLDLQSGIDFLTRCPKGRFKIATEMLAGQGPDIVTVEIEAPANFKKDIRNHKLSTSIKVRFVRVELKDGQVEVLVTSLTDETITLADFKDLYYLRWGIETFFGILKTRLGLENFSGLSAEAVKQDFYSMIFVTGSETILTMDAEEQLDKQTGGQIKKVNKAVSFNKIKDQALDLYFSPLPSQRKLAELTRLFMTSPTVIRPNRNPPRNKPSSRKVLGFWKRTRKEVF